MEDIRPIRLKDAAVKLGHGKFKPEIILSKESDIVQTL